MRGWLRLIPLTVVAGLVTGCGSQPSTAPTTPPTTMAPVELEFPGKSAVEIAAASVTALQAASSVHVSGSFIQDGKPMTIDLRYNRSHDGIGTFSTDGMTFSVKKIGEYVYVQGDDAFLTSVIGANQQTMKILRGKWIKAKVATLSALAGFFDIAEVMFKDRPTDLHRAGSSFVNGTMALALAGNASGDGTLWVAIRGEPYPVRLDAGADGVIDFTEYGATVDTTAPPASQIFDLSG